VLLHWSSTSSLKGLGPFQYSFESARNPETAE
jgi:hypothetical protein